ncbi:auxin efflux carrier [Backusella circina FSU 941]|nr:auxin efflux carrier [Backusella circina FSU 941]
MQVMVVVFFGSVLAKYGYFNEDKQKWLSKLNLVFFTPCLLFSNIASVISFQKLLAFWPIPVFYFTFAILNFTSSHIISRMVGLNAPYRRFVLACVMFSNSNSLPIATISSLAVSEAAHILYWGENDTQEAVAARGISYTLFFAIFGNLIRWSYGYQLLRRHKDDDASTIHADDEEVAPTTTAVPKFNYQSFDSKSASSSMEDEELPYDNTLAQRGRQLSTLTLTPDESTRLVNNKTILSPAPSSRASSSMSGTMAVVPWYKRAWNKVNSFMSPPLYAALLALMVGLSPLKSVLYDKQSFLYPSFTKAIETCGKAAVPLILTCLGAQLVSIQQETQESSSDMKKPVATAIFVRMIFMPFLVVPVVILFLKLGLSSLASDPVFATMMIVLGCAPTAINLVQITQVNHIFEEEMLRMLFWSYGVVCVPVCTFVVFLALNVVDRLL